MGNKTIIFTSDLHLAKNRPDLTRLFETFIKKHATKADVVYLMGDLFEAWVGDDDKSAFNQKIIELIQSLADKNIETFFIPGNRDFLIGERFCAACNMQKISDPSIVNHNGKTLLLSHGDIFCTDDSEYQEYRNKIQSPASIYKIQKLPLFIRKFIAWVMRKRSERQFSNVTRLELQKFDTNIESILEDMKESHADIIIHGHTHLPGIDLMQDNKQRYVLSDWGKQGNYLIMEPGQLLKHVYFG